MRKIWYYLPILSFIFVTIMPCDLYSAPPVKTAIVNGSIDAKVAQPKFPLHPVAPGMATKKLSSKPVHENAQNLNAIKLDFSATLAGTWQEVIGNVCFWHTYPGTDTTQLILMIGLPVSSTGNGGYQSTGWDKKVFWLDAGDGVPMHLPMQYYADPDDIDVKTYLAYNLYYRQKGKDYSKYKNGGQYAAMGMTTDLDNNPQSCVMFLFDENGQLSETMEPKTGDQIQSWTYSMDPEEPDIFYVTTMEDSYRTITDSMNIFYDHLTPNVDFPNAMTQNLINFSEVELIYMLEANKADDQGKSTYAYSKPVGSNTKWKNVVDSLIRSWHLFDFFKQ